MDYNITLKLSELLDVQITQMEDVDGNLEEGIFIPFKKNNIFKGRKYITMKIIAKENKKNTFGQSHFLIPNWGKREELQKRRETFGRSPIVGEVYPFHYHSKKIVPYGDMVNKDYLNELLDNKKREL